MKEVGGRANDPSWAVLAATAGLTMVLLMAADLYVELLAAGCAYAWGGAVVHHGTQPAIPETTE